MACTGPVTNRYGMIVETGMYSTVETGTDDQRPTTNDRRTTIEIPSSTLTETSPQRRLQSRKIRYDPCPVATSRVSPSGVVLSTVISLTPTVEPTRTTVAVAARSPVAGRR